ncbi:MAG TPA: hypothetical protein VHV77_08835 [Pirellulales bacterium]|nr:hypothetical protein [Pirellulales bacterium]
MANNVTNVTLSIHVKLPGSNIIKVETVLINGTGFMTEALDGGRATIELTLQGGEALHKLAKNEPVYVRGTMNGHTFTLPGPLEVVRPSEPWTLAGTV